MDYDSHVTDTLDQWGALTADNIIAAILKTPGLKQRLGRLVG